jgi:uncharacterized membrane protein (UPF0182 family)
MAVMRVSRRVLVAAAALLAIVVLPATVDFYTDWLWFGETGYRQVFVGTLAAQSQLGAAAMGLSFVVLFANVLIALRTLAPRDWVLVTREGPISISLDRRRLQPAATALVAWRRCCSDSGRRASGRRG